MSTLRAKVLQHLEETHGVDEKTVAENLSHVIKGEKVTESFTFKDGQLTLARRTVTRTPKDMALGTVVYDALTGGQLGLAPRLLKSNAPQLDLYERYNGQVNGAIVQNVHVRELLTSKSEPLLPVEQEKAETLLAGAVGLVLEHADEEVATPPQPDEDDDPLKNWK